MITENKHVISRLLIDVVDRSCFNPQLHLVGQSRVPDSGTIANTHHLSSTAIGSPPEASIQVHYGTFTLVWFIFSASRSRVGLHHRTAAHKQHSSIFACVPPSCPVFTHLKVTPHKVISLCFLLMIYCHSYSGFTVALPPLRLFPLCSCCHPTVCSFPPVAMAPIYRSAWIKWPQLPCQLNLPLVLFTPLRHPSHSTLLLLHPSRWQIPA